VNGSIIFGIGQPDDKDGRKKFILGIFIMRGFQIGLWAAERAEKEIPVAPVY
jgi:hypothetical protein